MPMQECLAFAPSLESDEPVHRHVLSQGDQIQTLWCQNPVSLRWPRMPGAGVGEGGGRLECGHF